MDYWTKEQRTRHCDYFRESPVYPYETVTKDREFAFRMADFTRKGLTRTSLKLPGHRYQM